MITVESVLLSSVFMYVVILYDLISCNFWSCALHCLVAFILFLSHFNLCIHVLEVTWTCLFTYDQLHFVVATVFTWIRYPLISCEVVLHCVHLCSHCTALVVYVCICLWFLVSVVLLCGSASIMISETCVVLVQLTIM